jgi:hypothetical protein
MAQAYAPARMPSFLRPLHTDEYRPPPLHPRVRRAILHANALADDEPLGRPDYWSGRCGTASGLLALISEWGEY